MSTGTCAQNIVNKMQARREQRSAGSRAGDSAERQGDRASIHGKKTERDKQGEREGKGDLLCLPF